MYWVDYSGPNYSIYKCFHSKQKLRQKTIHGFFIQFTFEADLLFLVGNDKAEDKKKEDDEEDKANSQLDLDKIYNNLMKSIDSVHRHTTTKRKKGMQLHKVKLPNITIPEQVELLASK